MIAMFLILMIVFTFVYNYLLVHENFPGITVMVIFLFGIFLYNLFTFGQYSSTSSESLIICSASAFEIIGLIYLLTLIRHKQFVRLEKQLEQQRRLSQMFDMRRRKHGRHQHLKTPQSPCGSPGSQMMLPHQRRYAGQQQQQLSPMVATSPPSIIISGTDDDNDNDNESGKSVDDNHEDYQSQNDLNQLKINEKPETEQQPRSKIKDDNSSKQFGSLLSVVEQFTDDLHQHNHHHGRRRRRRRHRSRELSPDIDRNDHQLRRRKSNDDSTFDFERKDSETSSIDHSNKHLNRKNLLNVPGVDSNNNNESDDDDDKTLKHHHKHRQQPRHHQRKHQSSESLMTKHNDNDDHYGHHRNFAISDSNLYQQHGQRQPYYQQQQNDKVGQFYYPNHQPNYQESYPDFYYSHDHHHHQNDYYYHQ